MDRKRALHFLSLGLSTGQVASIVGVSPGRISQFIAEPEIKAQLEIAQLEGGEKTVEEERIEAKQTAVKNDLLDALSKRSNEASFMEIARAYEIVCRAESLKKNNIPIAGAQIFNGTIVQISLPQKSMQEEIEVTKDREVISIGGRELTPMPSGQVLKLFRSMKEQDYEPQCLQSSPIEGHC